MPYEFGNLSPADFEDLTRDLVGRELGIRFEAFAAGPDGGMDGRHAKGENAIILQAKHYGGSPYSALKAEIRRERPSIDRLSPARYVLATSRALTPSRKEELAALIGPSLHDGADIIGPADLNGLLRKYPEIEKSHIKLWLSGAGVLERVLRSAAHTFNNITRDEIEATVRVYAPNPSFYAARDTLEAHHLVIISGPPGVGKTTLAEMLSYAYLAERWDLVAIRSLDDGFAAIEDSKKQVFFFDDFLGKVALDRTALSHKDSDLARFIKRVRHSPNARFILTTRAYIFEEARLVSEYLADHRLDISKYVLDVGIYTRRIKARILYNHLLVAGTPQTHIDALVGSGLIAKIIDHKNYNPRIIDWMTDRTRVGDILPEAYPAAFVDALAHPRQLWDIAFRTHISKMCQHLLLALFFSSEYGVGVEELKLAYENLHPRLCAKYGDEHGPKDYEEAIRTLEGGFIKISAPLISFVNPSLRDYLTGYLNDKALLCEIAASATQTEFAQAVWSHCKTIGLPEYSLKAVAMGFLNIAGDFLHLPVWIKTRDERYGITLTPTGLTNTRRIELLIAWYEYSGDQRFCDLALALARAPIDGLDSWRDGDDVIELIGKLRDGGYFDELAVADELADCLEKAAIDMIHSGMASDDLEKISDAVEKWQRLLGSDIARAVDAAIVSEINDVENIVQDIDSESTLTDHIETLQKLAKRTGLSTKAVSDAVEKVMERIAVVEERSTTSSSPSIGARFNAESDKFDDVALQNLFAPLVHR
jgi:DNA polymerase III delta prime subunit